TDVVASCFNHQGRTVTVISLHNKFDLPFTLNENKTHIILAMVDDDLKGFWVDQAIDIMPLSTFETNVDYFPKKDKAYSNFLLRDKDIILQTSFERLHKCEGSNLNWVTKLATKEPDLPDESAVSDVEVEEITEISKSENKAEAIELENRIEKSEVVDVVDDVIETRQETKIDASDSYAAISNRAQLTRTKNKSETNKNSQHDISSRTYPSLQSSQVNKYADSYIEAESEITNKTKNKDNDLFILIMGLMIIVTLGVTGIYLFNLDSDTGSRNKRQMTRVHDMNKISAMVKVAPVVIEQPTNAEVKDVSEQKLSDIPKIDPSENESLNEVVQHNESIVESSTTARIFELHIKEQSDIESSSDIYAITSFESATSRHENAPDTQRYTHIVVKGDTLWHITRRYLKNPNRYPELAAASHINNPHRIYPGDVIKIIVDRAKKK
ncbi:MAG: LysM peptidoglycan-binding domain-containing protein, partial [Gammaproteobacteria bacterium]|nr:LysM peptidoglycan-binding domain-containing protein [Gammaproteobacteria bacterium]